MDCRPRTSGLSAWMLAGPSVGTNIKLCMSPTTSEDFPHFLYRKHSGALQSQSGVHNPGTPGNHARETI
ncbi:hypothetical protein HMPREF0290_0175 [Corynebacterium efficiens YS-314]|nr:hypothetical protein HMPREF0290_0175 [Corynebacterium efficiens YS-314]